MDFVRRTWAEISLDAITHNFNEIKNKIGDRAKICCVIKADGYGHGAVELAHIYERLGADFFAVSNIDEGIEIRASGAVKLPILILGYTPVRDAQRLAQYNISQAVFSLDYAKALSAQCAEYGCVCKIHIKCDTGMSRIGFMCQEFPRDDDSIGEILEACALTKDALKSGSEYLKTTYAVNPGQKQEACAADSQSVKRLLLLKCLNNE